MAFTREDTENKNDCSSLASIQLGFSEPIDVESAPFIAHRSPDWRNWDGGKIGGRPSWLNPRHLPKQALACRECTSSSMRFISQLYAPADHVHSSAFHRSLYVFACLKCASIRVLRTQLPKENEYYPINPSDCDNIDEWTNHLPSHYNINLCQVCGQRAKGKCPTQGVHVCGTEHQKEHKKYIYNKQKKTKSTTSDSSSDLFLPSVYAESEIVVEQEPEENQDDNDDEEKDPTTMFFHDDNDDNSDSDEDLEQDDLNEMVGATQNKNDDPTTLEFNARINRQDARNQVLRYYGTNPNDEKEPLWIQSNHVADSIPNCPYCHAPRQLEFQIMPQMLYHLLKHHRQQSTNMSPDAKQAFLAASTLVQQAAPETISPALKDNHDKMLHQIQDGMLKSSGELDWGVVAVYTCSKSCEIDCNDFEESELGAYREEFAWRQPPLE